MSLEFVPYGKTPRLENVHCTITEKIDGTNGQIIVHPDGTLVVGSRNRVLVSIGASCGGIVWEKPGKGQDNFGFGSWAVDNYSNLLRLGPGIHCGEWAGAGIGRRYNKPGKTFVLFNSDRYERSHANGLPEGIETAPVLYRGPFTQDAIEQCKARLAADSVWAPGFPRPEGFIVRVLGHVMKVVLDK